MPKKGLSTVVAAILILLVAVSSGVAVYTWFTSFQEEFTKKQQFVGDARNLEILGVQYINERKALLGLRNSGESFQIVESVRVGDQDCQVVGTNVVEEVSNVFIECPTDLEENYDLKITTNRGISAKTVTSFEVGPDTQDNFVFNNLTVTFRVSNVCEIWETKIYGMHFTNSSHVEIPSLTNYGYSVCLNHSTYAITTLCTDSHSKTMFTLGDETNSHIYTDTSSVAQETTKNPYDFTDVCISTLGTSSINLTTSSSQPDPSFSCIGTTLIDNFAGGVVSDCTYPGSKIWAKIYKE